VHGQDFVTQLAVPNLVEPERAKRDAVSIPVYLSLQSYCNMLNLAVAFFFSTNFSLANNIFESSGTNMATEIHRGDGLFLIPE
jgi:hypothetical protein